VEIQYVEEHEEHEGGAEHPEKDEHHSEESSH
jgi:hypothetical protein